MYKEICWNITTKCNQRCQYCHRFLNMDELPYEYNKKILENLIKDNIRRITWTGGEALLYPKLIDLLKLAKKNNIYNKLITNGELLAREDNMRDICNFLDELTLSIDSINNETNEHLGRGSEHVNNIKKVLEYAQTKNLNVNINTVVSKMNIHELKDLAKFLNNYPIKSWRVFKFMPLRETAIKNRKEFEISNIEFEKSKNIFKKYTNIPKIEYRQENDMEDNYILILANGDIVKTENNEDVKEGNALCQHVTDFI